MEEARTCPGAAPASLSSGGRARASSLVTAGQWWGRTQGGGEGRAQSFSWESLLPCASLTGKRGSTSATGDHLPGGHRRRCSPVGWTPHPVRTDGLQKYRGGRRSGAQQLIPKRIPILEEFCQQDLAEQSARGRGRQERRTRRRSVRAGEMKLLK